jgi:hypothetical protein
MSPPTATSCASIPAGSPTISRQRVRACANLAAIAERRRARAAGQQARRRAEHRREAHEHRDHLPLFDADWAAVEQLAHGQRCFAAHTGPPAPTDAEKPRGEPARRIQRHESSRLRATYDAERWLAIWALRSGGTGGPTIAALLGISERQVERWTQRPTVGWPHGVDAILLPGAGADAVQDTPNRRVLGTREQAG